MAHIEVLDLAENDIQELPLEICQCAPTPSASPGLPIAGARRCGVPDAADADPHRAIHPPVASPLTPALPGSPSRLKNLKKLYLDNNQLTTLPHTLHLLSQTLTLLGVANNPLDDLVMQQYLCGLPALLAYLKVAPSASPPSPLF